MPYDSADADRMVRDSAVAHATRLGDANANLRADIRAGGGSSVLVNGYFDDEGTWVGFPDDGVLFFGPPGLG